MSISTPPPPEPLSPPQPAAPRDQTPSGPPAEAGHDPHLTSPATEVKQPPVWPQGAGWFRSVDPRSLWTGAAAAASSYVLLVVVSVLLLLLALIGVIAGNGGSLGSVDVPGEGEVSAWSQLGQMAVQLIALGHFGTLQTTIEGVVPLLGAIRGQASSYAVPLILFVLGAVFIHVSSGIAERKVPSASRQQLLSQALVTGVLYSLLVNVAASIFAMTYPPLNGITVAPISAVGFWSVAMSLCLGAGVSLLARRRVMAVRADVRASSKLAAQLNLPLTAVTVHALVFAVVAVPVVWIAAAVLKGWPAALTAPLWILNATGYALVTGHLGGISVVTRSAQAVGGSGSRNDEQLIYGFGADAAGSSAVGLGWACLALALVSAVAAGTVILLRRGRVENTNIMPWIPVPVAFLLLGILLPPLLTVSGNFSLPGMASASMNAAPAWWSPVVFLLWGVLVELSARFLSPSVIPLLPARLVYWARIGMPFVLPMPAPAAASQAADSDVLAATPGSGDDVSIEPPVRKPLSAADRKRRKLIAAAAGLVVVLAIGGVVTANVIKANNGADKVVDEYLQALVDGDAEKAVHMSDPGVPSGERTLLTNKVYQAAAKRMDGFRILSTDIQDDTATVRAEVSQDGRKRTMSYTLVKGDAKMLDDDWRLNSRLHSSVMIAADSNVEAFAVNGVTIATPLESAGASRVTLPAFPGEYVVGIPASEKFITAKEISTVVEVGPVASARTARLEISPTEEFKTTVAAKIDAVLATCAASTTLDPAGCPFDTYISRDVRSISWSIKEKPEYQLDNSYGEDWRIRGKKSGTAEVTFERNSSYDSNSPEWKKETRSVPFRTDGTVRLASGEVTLELSTY